MCFWLGIYRYRWHLFVFSAFWWTTQYKLGFLQISDIYRLFLFFWNCGGKSLFCVSPQKIISLRAQKNRRHFAQNWEFFASPKIFSSLALTFLMTFWGKAFVWGNKKVFLKVAFKDKSRSSLSLHFCASGIVTPNSFKIVLFYIKS